MESVNNFIKIQSNKKLNMSPDGDFFRAWVEFFKPVHKLTNREMDVLAMFMKERYNLGKVILDADVLDKVLMSEGTKRKIREACGVTPRYFQVIMCKFRRNKVINNNKIALNLLPSITDDGVGLLIYFDFKNEQHIKLGLQEDGKVF